MSKSNFIVRGGADFSGIKKGLDQTQKQLTNFQNNVNKSMKVVGAVLSTLAVGKFVKDSTKMAMGVESSIGNIGRNMSTASAAFNNWAQTQSKAWGMARADAYKYGSTFSNLLASFSEDAKETADNTQELMKAAAIIASKTGRSYQDTAERIRSGMLGSTEAIEDLGVYTNISMIESTKAFKKFANGKTWAQLDFRVQQQIRLAAILEQTYARYGDSLADNTQTRQARFIATLKNIQLNLGQAFLPIYNAVLPVLTAMGNKLESVTEKLKYFTQAIFGKAIAGPVAQTEDQAAAIAGVGDAAEAAGNQTAAAAKKAKGAVAGFDEINSLADKSDSAGAGTGEGLAAAEMLSDGELGQDTNVSSDFSKAVDAIKGSLNTIKSYINTFIAPPFQDAVNLIKPKVEEFKAILSDMWGDIGSLGAPLKTWFLADFTPFLQNVIRTSGDIISGLFDTFNKVFSDIWKSAVYPVLKTLISIGLPLVTEYIDKSVSLFGALFSEVKKIFDLLWSEGVKPALDLIATIWTDTTTIIADTWYQIMDPVFTGMQNAFVAVGDLLRTVWETTIKPVWDTFMETLDWLWKKHFKPLVSNLMGSIGELVGYLVTSAFKIINEFIIPLVKAFMETFGPAIAAVFSTVISVLGTFLATTADILSGVITVIKGILQFLMGVFMGDWQKAWEGIVNVFRGIFEGVAGIVKGVVNTVIDIINSMLRSLQVGINFAIEGINDIIRKANKVPGVSIPMIGTITIGKIPKLAQGGITNGPTLAMIGDNPGGREVVSPLDDLTDMIASAVGSAMMGAMQFGSFGSDDDREIVLKIGETEISRATLKAFNKEAIRLGYRPILQTR